VVATASGSFKMAGLARNGSEYDNAAVDGKKA
jgi:hypothetical protein